MYLRHFLCLALICIFLGFAGSAAAAQSFAVAPFTMHAPKKYHYLSEGLRSMITSRLSSDTNLQPRDMPELADTGKLTRSRALEILKRTDLDYLVYGDVTMMQEQSSLSLNILSREGELLTSTSQTSLDKLIPSLDTLVGDLKQDLQPALKQDAVAQKGETDQRGDVRDREQNATKRQKSGIRLKQDKEAQNDTEQAKLNPQFQHTRKKQRETNRWQSRELPFAARGMRVGDANGDGREEIFLLQEDAVKAFVKRKSGLELLATYETGRRIKTLTLELLPPDSEGLRRILVSALRDKTPGSFILAFREGEFILLERNIKILFSMARIPPDYEARLVGQKLDAPGIFDNGVSLVERDSGEYKLGRTLDLPAPANVFNFAYLPQKKGYKVIVADSMDHLRTYSSGGELKASTDKTYAGSTVKMEKKTSLPGLEEARHEPVRYYYLPTRLIPCDLDADNEFEILVNRSVSTSTYLARQRGFSSGAIHSLYWDGLGLNIAWKTEAIKGAVQDYGLGDINNDGVLELVVCLNTQPGMLSWEEEKTILLAYPLELSRTSRQAIFRP